jgi:hypothetical protein
MGALGAAAVAVGVWIVAFGLPRMIAFGPPADRAVTTTVKDGCADTPLDESKVPETSFALRDALRNGIAPYFQCSSRQMEQFASTYAMLSVVIAQYAPSAACFHGDQGAASLERAVHKSWADRQGNPASLLGGLQWKIDSALNCMDASRQRPFFVDMARTLKAATSAL